MNRRLANPTASGNRHFRLHRSFIWSALFALLLGGCADESITPPSPPDTPDYTFDGAMPRNVLVSYLTRAMTMSDLCLDDDWPNQAWDANLAMIARLRPMLLSRVIYAWGWEDEYLDRMGELATRTAAIHAIDPRIILQGAIFEFVSERIEQVPVPAAVQAAFGLTPVARTYDLDRMRPEQGDAYEYAGWPFVAIQPDITRLETQMWYYQLATRYIDAGLEAIHLGAFPAVASHDHGYVQTQALLQRIRAYAGDHARRHWVLLDAHTHGMTCGKQLLLDFHSWPLRPREIAGAADQDATLQAGYLDAIYGRSQGGVTPAGWYAHSLPFLVEFDNGYAGGIAGACNLPECVWGNDEITWFAEQSRTRRDAILRNFAAQVRALDPDGWLAMPGMRPIVPRDGGDCPFYFLVDESAFPDGGSQENAVASIWDATTDTLREREGPGADPGPPVGRCARRESRMRPRHPSHWTPEATGR